MDHMNKEMEVPVQGGRRRRRRQTCKHSKRGHSKTCKKQQRGGQDPIQKIADMMKAGKKQQKKGGNILKKVIGGNAEMMQKLGNLVGKS